METIARGAPPTIAWFGDLAARPQEAVADFIAGYARVPPYHGQDSRSLALTLFEPLDPDDAIVAAFDRGLLGWLDERRRAGVPVASEMVSQRFIAEVSQALDIVGLLELPLCAADFRKRYILWNNWVERLIALPQRDARLAFWRALALTQRTASRDPQVQPLALEPQWLRICEGSGNRFSSSYLSVGLLGLQMLPVRDDTPSVLPWMTGLARWAAAQNPPLADFKKQWWALKSVYPRVRTWRRVLDGVLDERKPEEHLPAQDICDFWRADAGGWNRNKQATPKGMAPKSVDWPEAGPIRIKQLIGRLSKPLQAIKPEIDQVLGEHRRYVKLTADSHFFVRTSCHIGMALIQAGDRLTERGAIAETLARDALAWEPSNRHAWGLWREALETQGRLEDAEDLGWEAIRRFPDDPIKRTQLAMLLARLPGRTGDAEALLTQTIERFPDDAIARKKLQDIARSQPAREREQNGPSSPRAKSKDISVFGLGRLQKLAWQASRAGTSEVARERIQAVLDQDPNIAYARYLQRPAGENEPPTLFAARFVEAIQAGDASAFDALRETGPNRKLVDFARAYLFGDEAAAENCLEWIGGANAGDSASVATLKSFVRLRVGPGLAEIRNATTFIGLIASNDNFRQDLIESAVAGMDLAIAA